MRYDHEHQGELTVVRVREDKITSHEAADVKTAFLQIITESQRILLLNLADVQYMDSTGLGSFLFGLRQADANEKEMVFCGLTERVQSLIHIAHLDTILEIYETEAEAVHEIMDDLAEEKAQ